MSKILETERLLLRQFNSGDAEFTLRLVNEPSWLRYIGDRNIRTLDDVRAYIQNGPVAMYAERGFGLYLVELKESGQPIGMCGLIKRDSLDDVDIGFAFVPEFWHRGYAFESAAAVLGYAESVLGLPRVVATTAQDNVASARLLGKLGLRFECLLPADKNGVQVCLYTPGGATNS